MAIRAAAVLFVTVLTATAAQVSLLLPFTPVAFTFPPMIVLLGGARLGALSQVLYLAAGWPACPSLGLLPCSPLVWRACWGQPEAAALPGLWRLTGLRDHLPRTKRY